MRFQRAARSGLALAIALASGMARGGEPAVIPNALVGSAPEVDSITPVELAGHLRFLSSDLMRGRDTASPEIRIVSEYLATRLSMFEAEPAGDIEDDEATYFAHFPLEYVTPKIEGTSLTLIVEGDDATREIEGAAGEDFVVFPRGLAPGTIEAPVVFAGYGRTGESDGPNDFDGLDVEDRVVLVLDGSGPGSSDEGVEPERGRRGRVDGGSYAKMRAAREAGALALLIVHPFDAEDARPYVESNPFATRMFGRSSMTLGESAADATPILYLEDDLRSAIDESAGIAEAPESPRELEGLRVRFTFDADRQIKRDRNVIGLFTGSDDDLKHEVVLFSAHYDHVGVGADGQIFNGSDDNGSGTSALLEIAKAFGKGPSPRRSVAFLWVSGEEKGLLGSKWWSEHMTLPDGCEIVADINMDMISRNDPDKIGVTPSAGHPDYSTIIPAAMEALDLEGMEPSWDADQFYARTDSYNFAAQGIPIVFFFSGVHEDYHEPGDDFEKADIGKAIRTARAAYRLGWAIAQADDRPRKIGPPGTEADEVDDEPVVEGSS